MREPDTVDGFQQPLHRSLTQPMFLAGAPRNLVIFNGGLAAIEFLIIKSWYLLPLNFVFHLLIVMVHRKDPQFYDCFIRYVRNKKYYST